MQLVMFLALAAVSLVLAACYVWIAPTRAERRLQQIAEPAPASEWIETVVKVAGPLAKLSTPQGDWENSPLRIRFLNAGIRRADARLVYFGAKTVLPVALALAAFTVLRLNNTSDSVVLLLVVMLAALVGCYLPNLALLLARRGRQREIFETFPDAADLLLVCVEAGLGLDAGLNKVAEEMRMRSVPLAEEMHLTNLELRAGGTREASLRNLALRTGVEELATFATVLTQANRFGTSVGDSLRVFSDDLRHKRQMLAEERAAKVPTKMLFPLVLFIFPSIMMVILAPAGIQIIRTLMPMFG